MGGRRERELSLLALSLARLAPPPQNAPSIDPSRARHTLYSSSSSTTTRNNSNIHTQTTQTLTNKTKGKRNQSVDVAAR
jgi:hypothetical protein